LCGPTISTVGNMLQIERLGKVKGQSVLCLKGPLTIENVSLFQSAIRREETFSTVILDLSDVPYIDSTALGALVSAYVSRQKVGRRVVLSGASERVSRMLKITSVESLFLTFPTLEDAISDLKRAGTAKSKKAMPRPRYRSLFPQLSANQELTLPPIDVPQHELL